MQLNLVVLRSPDMHRAVEFYRALGLEFTLHAHGSGPEHYSTDLSGTVFEIYPLTAKSGPTTGMRIGFQVESADRISTGTRSNCSAAILPRLEQKKSVSQRGFLMMLSAGNGLHARSETDSRMGS